MPRLSRALTLAVPVAVLGLVAACSGGGDDDGADLGVTSSTAAPQTPEVPAESAPGTGVVVIGGTTASFAVTECELDIAPAEGGTGPLVRVTGEGTRANGVPFAVEVTRTATEGEASTYTDLVTYTDTARILQLQRFEVSGEVSDLRDPDARSTLLRVRDGGLSAAGIAGPPGTSAPAGPGLVGLSVDATC